MMPVGPILLAITVVLAGFGCLDGLLPRMGLTPRQAVALALLGLAGSLLDFAPLPGLVLNLGGTVLPVLLAALLLSHEVGKGLAGACVAGVAAYGLTFLFAPHLPTELDLYYLDAQYLYALVAALLAYAVTRSPRSAFAAAALGVPAAGLAFYVQRLWVGEPVELLKLGGGGFYGTAWVAGCLAAALAHWMHPLSVERSTSSLLPPRS